jgi:Uroporphyrinogen-III decarboxylase
MNSKERVKSALSRAIPDKVPAGEFAIDFDTVERILGHETYLRAKAKSQMAFWEGRRDEVVQSWKEDAVELYRKLEVYDIVNVGAMAFGQAPPAGYRPEPPKLIAPDTWEDREGRVFKLSEATKDISLVSDPLEWEREFDLSDYPAEGPVDAPDPSEFEVVDYVIRELGKDRYILWGAGDEGELPALKGESSPLSERSLCMMALEPELCDAAAAYQFRRACARDDYCLRPGQDGVMWAQDFAYKAGPMISPDMFRRYVTRYAKQRVRILRERGLPVFKHACGNNWELMDQFAEIGYACYQSIQPTASMDLAEVKARYGDRLCLWGGVPVEHLVDGTMDEVRMDVRRAVEAGKEGGGYVFGSSHSIAVGTKYDNFMAMLDEFVKVRDY